MRAPNPPRAGPCPPSCRIDQPALQLVVHAIPQTLSLDHIASGWHLLAASSPKRLQQMNWVHEHGEPGVGKLEFRIRTKAAHHGELGAGQQVLVLGRHDRRQLEQRRQRHAPSRDRHQQRALARLLHAPKIK